MTPSIANATLASLIDRLASLPCYCTTCRSLHVCHPVPDDVRSIDSELETRRHKRFALRPWNWLFDADSTAHSLYSYLAMLPNEH